MLLDKLFRQYKKERKPCFGSRFGAFWAKLMIGSPRDKNLGDLYHGLQTTLYHRPADRHPPRDESGLRAWEEGSKLVNDTRVIEEPIAAKSQSLATILVTMMLCGVGAISIQLRTATAENQTTVPTIGTSTDVATQSVNNADLSPAYVEACRKKVKELTEGGGQNPALATLVHECRLAGFNEH